MTDESTLIDALLGGRWRLRAPVARSSVAVTYAAVDVATHTNALVKVYATSDAQVVERIAARGMQSRALASPAVMPVLGCGTTGGVIGRDAAYVVNEMLEGETLREQLERRVVPMPAQSALSLLRLLAAAVADVHARGFVHRDISPSTCFVLAPHDASARRTPVKLYDLGTAVPRGEVDAADAVAYDRPIYTAPELLGGPGEISPASDVYSLGMILYELVTGEPPVERDAAAIQITAQQLEGDLAPLPENLRHTDVAGIYARATDPDPSARYPDAAELLDAIDAGAAAPRARLPSMSPFSSVTIDDSIDGDVQRIAPPDTGAVRFSVEMVDSLAQDAATPVATDRAFDSGEAPTARDEIETEPSISHAFIASLALPPSSGASDSVQVRSTPVPATGGALPSRPPAETPPSRSTSASIEGMVLPKMPRDPRKKYE